jgi:uncharacterized membrane protein YfcA
VENPPTSVVCLILTEPPRSYARQHENDQRIPIDRVLTIALVLAPAVALLSTVLYATRGWYDAIAGVVHVIAAILGALLVVRLVTYLDRLPVLAAVALVVGLVGAAGG